MKKICRRILASLCWLVGGIVCLFGIVLCMTVVLIPIGLGVFGLGGMIGAIGVNLWKGLPVLQKPSSDPKIHRF